MRIKTLFIVFFYISALSAFDIPFLSSNKSLINNKITGSEQSRINGNLYDTENVAGRINNITRFLTDQLTQNKNFYKISEPIIAITSLVYFSDYDKSNKLGNIVAENMIHEMQVRGYRVLDYKVMPVIKITPDGDFAISRNMKKLKQKYLINYVLTGTIIEMYNGMVLNMRIVDLSTNLVLSSAQAFIDKKTYFLTVKEISSLHNKNSKQTKKDGNAEEPKVDDNPNNNWITPLLEKDGSQ